MSLLSLLLLLYLVWYLLLEEVKEFFKFLGGENEGK